MSTVPASVPEIAQSLLDARQQAGLSVAEAADRAGLVATELAALESGAVTNLHDRVETLRTLRIYANSLGLAGDDYVLAAVESWPVIDQFSQRRGDTGAVPVVSVSSAPPGGHSRAGTPGALWAGDATGVTDSTITGVVAAAPMSVNETGQVPIFTTGEVPLIRSSAPFLLQVMVGVTALLVVLGCIGLAEHEHVAGWAHDGRTTASHLVHDAKVAMGLSSNPVVRHHHRVATPPSRPHVAMVENPTGRSVVVNVSTSSYTVKIVAFKYACWVDATEVGQPKPVFERIIPGGQSQVFTISKSTTIETASSSGRAYMYKGTQFIGFYIPSKAPFTMTFNATS